MIVALQVRVNNQTMHDIFRTPKFYGVLEGGTQLLVVSKDGECFFYQMKDIDGYRQISVREEDAFYNFVDEESK